ncbi:MAG TPA: LysR family transcriptional regulator [Candidatus Acutalibacter ornithocaccae]|uniref:LysR family transcriptional regulator n=1 Tax=Candidatus Acutalibacter ornithocaccae TaxID=2838416 RepID=A0A9D2M084_9FIRM|nr:LysR family transcriptional regulator [Candidatus Acutalibacter ornithocaccae]
MTRKHFTIFVEVCRFLNFSQAAEALNTTQPAVSLAVKELESHYGVALFERMNRRVYLTPAGEALLATAQDVLRGFQEAEETLGQGRPLALRVGANVSFGEAGLAQVLGRFRQEHPQVRLRALVANSDKIQSLLAENQLDVGIVDGLGVSERLRAQPLYQEDLVLAAAPGRFPAPATVEELAALPLLLREPGSGLRSSVDRVFSQQGLAPQPLLESTSTAALAQAAKAGLGVAILPEALAQRESGLQVGAVPEVRFFRQFACALHRQKAPSPALEAFLALLRDQTAAKTGPLSL